MNYPELYPVARVVMRQRLVGLIVYDFETRAIRPATNGERAYLDNHGIIPDLPLYTARDNKAVLLAKIAGYYICYANGELQVITPDEVNSELLLRRRNFKFVNAQIITIKNGSRYFRLNSGSLFEYSAPKNNILYAIIKISMNDAYCPQIACYCDKMIAAQVYNELSKAEDALGINSTNCIGLIKINSSVPPVLMAQAVLSYTKTSLGAISSIKVSLYNNQIEAITARNQMVRDKMVDLMENNIIPDLNSLSIIGQPGYPNMQLQLRDNSQYNFIQIPASFRG